jgi:hypothetical protein
MATPLLASFTPVDYDPADTGWEEVHYDDGRPSAGVLAMNAMWWRYESNFANFNRSRAAAITRILLCRDMFERTVSFSSTGGALSTDEIDDAVHNQAECLACHATLDPLSATMFGFYTSAAEIVTYRPEREALGPEMLEVEKAYYGTPVESLADVGELIAADPRFPRCTTQHMAQALWARDLEDGDAATIDGLDADFVRGGLLLKPLLAAITETEEYRLGAVALDTPEDDLPDYAAARMMPPDMLADAVEEATGFRWVIGETDLMSEDDDGFRQIAGGVDGISQLRTQRVPGVMWTLVVKRLAEAAAGHVVDRASDGEPLFAHALLTTRSTDPEFALEVEELWWHLTATRLTDAEVQAYADLFDTVEALDGTESAWQSVIAAMLRDPAFLFY